ATFTAIDNSFFTSGILSELDSGPLKLYLYFSHAAKNEYGHSWHSIQTIADYFGTQTRTIDNWIRSLVDKNLIYRAPKGQKSYTTYLIPFSDTLISHPAPRKYATDNQELLNDLVEYIQGLESIYGKIVGVHHLFQWIIKDKKITGSTQRL